MAIWDIKSLDREAQTMRIYANLKSAFYRTAVPAALVALTAVSPKFMSAVFVISIA